MSLELPHMGHEVTVCPDGLTAAAALEVNTYDCILVERILRPFIDQRAIPHLDQIFSADGELSFPFADHSPADPRGLLPKTDQLFLKWEFKPRDRVKPCTVLLVECDPRSFDL